MEGDDSSRRISQLEWRLQDAEKLIKLAGERIQALEQAQERAEQTISQLTSTVAALTAGPVSDGPS